MLKKLLKQIHNRLIKHRKTIAVAESCTGGQLAVLLTSLPGASEYFLLGLVAYSNKSKEKILGIPSKIIARYGAVSRQVAVLMAKNIRRKTSANLSLGITGIAGPTGASSGKPVGTVYICLSKKNRVLCRKFNFCGSRRKIRNQAAQAALNLLCAHLSP
ncbi:MAG: CinA family protein [Candidatus Omnitrophica bacterium]|nr:CinA family protein [Candidatus Omnitrophota bacterium]